MSETYLMVILIKNQEKKSRCLDRENDGYGNNDDDGDDDDNDDDDDDHPVTAMITMILKSRQYVHIRPCHC